MEKSIIDKLMELKQLYESGILTKEEMEAEKKKILGESSKEEQQPSYPPRSEPEAPCDMPKQSIISENKVELFFQKYKAYIICGIVALFVIIGIITVPKMLSTGSSDIVVENDSIAVTYITREDTINAVTSLVSEIYMNVLSDPTRNWEEKYFSEDYYDWYSRIKEYDTKNHMGELGFFGGKNIWTDGLNGNDLTAEVVTVSIEEHPIDGHTLEAFTYPYVEVIVKGKGKGKEKKLYWPFINYDGAWKIFGSLTSMQLYVNEMSQNSGSEMWFCRYVEAAKDDYNNKSKYLSSDFKSHIKKVDDRAAKEMRERCDIWGIGSDEWIDDMAAKEIWSNNSQADLEVILSLNDNTDKRSRKVHLVVENGSWAIDDIDGFKEWAIKTIEENGEN